MNQRAALFASLLMLMTSVGAAEVAVSKAPASKAEVLLTEQLPPLAAKEVVMLTVELPPGAASAPHRHNGHVYVYVLEGSIVMKTSNGPEKTLVPGQTFVEKPEDVHTVSRNASATAPAKFLVVMIKDPGTPITVPVKTASEPY